MSPNVDENTEPKDLVGLDPNVKSVKHTIDEDEEQSETIVLGQDLFQPFPVDEELEQMEDEDNILRVRCIFVGAVLGGVVNAANLYLGLKTGITFPANLFGSILGFTILKSISKSVPEDFPILGGKFGPKENNIVQTSATAAGGLSNIFIGAVPAMYQMGLLKAPRADYGKIATFTLGAAYVGFFFATPLRNLLIIRFSRQLSLIFPTATATATTIRSAHAAVEGESGAMKKVKVLLIAFSLALLLRVVSNFAPGILWDWHVFTWFFIWGKYHNSAILVENWGWYFSLTPAIIGSGMMIGMNTVLSMFAGTLVSWGIIGPVLVRTNTAKGLLIMGDDDTGPWKNFTTYFSMSLKDPVNAPSPRYWLLWPGVLLMVAVSIAELACQYRLFKYAAVAAKEGLANALCSTLNLVGYSPVWLQRHCDSYHPDGEDTGSSEHHQIKGWMWTFGLLTSIIVTCISCGVQWSMPVGMTIVSIILAAVFTFLAVMSTGMTDMTPLTAVSKSSQLILGGMTRHGQYTLPEAQILNSIGGIIATGVANQATDLTADFRVGYLLRTPARAQWLAQGIASLVAIFLAPAIFIIFVTAYPCVLDLTATSCAFTAPTVSAWRAATIAATSPTLPIPKSSGIFAICLSILGCATVAFKHLVLTGEKVRYRVYVPNFMAFGIMMVVPSPSIGVAILTGGIIAYTWQRFWFQIHEQYLSSVVAGMIAGEGIGGVINAIIAIAGVTAGTGIGCPAGSC